MNPKNHPGRFATRLAQLTLIVAVLLAFAPAFVADFSCWDDNYNIAQNPHLNPPTWQSIGFFWSHPTFDLYVPVTYSLWAVLARLAWVPQPDTFGWHLNPYIFHAANIFVHIGSTLLVFSILRKFVSILPAWIGAMIFAIHPVQVESVAWIAGMKDVLDGFFALISLRLYLADGSARRQKICFGLAILSLLIAMLAKPIAMVVPLMAGAMDLILHRRPIRQIAIRFVLWLPLAIACAIIAHHVQPPKFSETFVPILSRPIVAGDALAFYLGKILWPVSLGIDYGRSPAAVLNSHIAWLACFVPIALAILLWIRRRQWKCTVAGAAIFTIALSPMLGFVPFDYQRCSTVTDHYLYLPMLGIALIAARIVAAWRGRVVLTISAIVLLSLMIRTFLQSQIWESPNTLFSHAVQVNPRSWISHENFSIALTDRGDLPAARQQALAAIQIAPNFTDAFVNLAHILASSGDLPAAIAASSRAVQISPDDFKSWTSLGHSLSAAGRRSEAIDAYRHAIQLDPNDAATDVNLASALAESGDLNHAIQWYQAALRIDPNSSEAKQGLAQAISERDRHAATQP